MYEESIDTTEQILEKGLIPYHHFIASWGDHLRQSGHPVYEKLAEITISPEDVYQVFELTEKLQEEGNLVYLSNVVSGSPSFPLAKLGYFHYSKETLLGVSPFSGWIVNKRWPFSDKLARHILKYQQVCTD